MCSESLKLWNQEQNRANETREENTCDDSDDDGVNYSAMLNFFWMRWDVDNVLNSFCSECSRLEHSKQKFQLFSILILQI